MSVVVGLVTPSGCWLGGDSFAGGGGMCIRAASPKVGKFGNLLLGFVGEWRVGQQYFEAAKKMGTPTLPQLIHYVQPDVIENQKADEVDNSWFLLAIENERLYEIDSTKAVIEVRNVDGVSYDAIGDGGSIALGALFVAGLDGQEDGSSVVRALEASAEHSPWVRYPFEIVSVIKGE